MPRFAWLTVFHSGRTTYNAYVNLDSIAFAESITPTGGQYDMPGTRVHTTTGYEFGVAMSIQELAALITPA
jgi:hypothetical protein